MGLTKKKRNLDQHVGLLSFERIFSLWKGSVTLETHFWEFILNKYLKVQIKFMLQDIHYSITYKSNKLEPSYKVMLHPYVEISCSC